MHAHDRKRERARTERIELMEACPVCGEQRRNSARFCTTCGHRFATDEIVNAPAPQAPSEPGPEPGDIADPVISGWPAPGLQATASPWARSTEERGGWPAPPVDSASSSDLSEVTWAEVAATALGAPRQAQQAAPAAIDTASDDDIEFEVTDDVDPGLTASNASHDQELRQRARALMTELRDVIDSLTGESPVASAELASDLEISLTRPAALEGEALAELRAAAESAQERPRDLDTLTALTAQAGSILALIVAYERAAAGIERALENIRGQRDSPASDL